MKQFHDAGGIPAVMKEIEDLLHAGCLTVTGRSVGENLRGIACYNRDVIRPVSQPLSRNGAIAVLRGNLAPAR